MTLRPAPLTRGPHAVVYRGWDRVHRCEVVVKVQRATDDPVAARRFEREAAVMLRLRHPSIVALYAYHSCDPGKTDAGANAPAAGNLVTGGSGAGNSVAGNSVASDAAALVMEYVPGPTLAALVAAEGRLPVARAVRVVEDIAAALDCIHALGIVHRDVKPSNILLPKHGPARLTDFGVARIDDDLPLTVMGDILGTIEYASPEQVHGNEAVGPRSDVYSLAAVSYFALTGTPPFRAADSSTQAQLSVMHRQVFSNPPPLRFHRDELSPALDEAVLRGLAKAPDSRYTSAGQFAAALRAAVVASAGEPQQQAATGSARRTGALAGALAAAALLAGFGFLVFRTGPKTAASKPAQTAASAWTVPAKPVPAKPVTPKPVMPKQASARLALGAAKPAPVQTVAPMPAKVAVKPAKASVKAAAKPVPFAVSLALLEHQAARAAPVPQPRSPLLASTNPPARKPAARKPVQATSAALAHRFAPAGTPGAAASGWYTVSGWIVLAGQSSAQKREHVRANPQWIKVDGHPLPALASGQWAALPAGTHQVTFQPSAGLGAGPKTWSIRIAPSARLRQQVPLPPAPLPDIPTHLRNP